MTRAPSPFKVKRAKLTKRERLSMYLKQRGLCGCGCGELLSADEGIVAEHEYEFVALGNAAKPDALWRKPCADAKTHGPRGDLNTIAHIRRLAEKRTQFDKRKQAGGSRIKGRGFEGWRNFSGEVVKRG